MRGCPLLYVEPPLERPCDLDGERRLVAGSRPKPNLPDHDQIVTTTESIHTPDVPGVNTLLIAAASDDMLVGSIAAEQARISEPTTPVLLRSSGI